MEQFIRPRFYGDSERWYSALEKIRSYSIEVGDNKDLEFLESLLSGTYERLNTDEKIQLDTNIVKWRVRYNDLSNKYKSLCINYDDLLDKHEILLSLQGHRQLTPFNISDNTKDSAIGFVQWSDWHVGETVTLEVTNGLNEYNPTIARKRVENLVNNTIKLIHKEKEHSDLEGIVIHLGGDFINGWIHEENQETNSLTPIEEIMFVSELLESALETILHNVSIPIKCVCSVGNHGRITKKFRFGSEAQTSFEMFLYSNLAKMFKDRIEFAVATSAIHYETFLGQKVRFIHGHQVRYMDGVGGLTIPLNKRQARWNATMKSDFNFMGHYHTVSMPNSKTVLNGSLVGYNGMAQFFGFEYEPPQQSFILYHSKYGWTGFHKISCE